MSEHEWPPSEEVRAARRMLEGHSRATLTGPLVWHAREGLWALPIRLRADTANPDLVPEVSDWYLLLQPQFPFGSVVLKPAKAGGIERTFPHQSVNLPGDEKVLWRTGEICFRSPLHELGRGADDPEPVGETGRLLWCVDRALEWLGDASRGTLVRPGDHYELPSFDEVANTVGFCEGEGEFAAWSWVGPKYGFADLVEIGGGPKAVRRFADEKGNALVAPHWGKLVRDGTAVAKAGWILLERPPILPPYQAPRIWGELTEELRRAGRLEDLRGAIKLMRAEKSTTLLVGFPIPVVVGGPSCRVHWQPIHIDLKNSAKGFTGRERGMWQHDVATVLGPKRKIEWLHAENWHPEQMSSRGRADPALRGKRVVLVGCGSLGSALAELLVRAGVFQIRLVDGESLVGGNLVRHTLTLADVGARKAERLAARLNVVSPHADVEARAEFLTLANASELLADRDLVIDCTGNDGVLQVLEMAIRPQRVRYCSVAVGVEGRRAFVFHAEGTSFPFAAFREAMQPWLRKEREERGDAPFPREGIGCWHPVFPAGPDRIWMQACGAFRELERATVAGGDSHELVVLDENPSEPRRAQSPASTDA